MTKPGIAITVTATFAAMSAAAAPVGAGSDRIALSPTAGSANEAFATLHGRAPRRASHAVASQGELS